MKHLSLLFVALLTSILSFSQTPAPITGRTTICQFDSTVLASATSGGVWSCEVSWVATVAPTTGVVRGLFPGTITITYTAGSSYTSMTMTVVPAPQDTHVLTYYYCLGDSGGHVRLDYPEPTTSYQLQHFGSGIPYGAPVVASYGTIYSDIYPVPTGRYDIVGTSILGGCSRVVFDGALVSVYYCPTASVYANYFCNGIYYLIASGGSWYSWNPGTGVASLEAGLMVTPTVNTTYVVTVIDGMGCTDTASISVIGNRIKGEVEFTGSSSDLKVWLIQYNPSDSSIVAVDSAIECSAYYSHYEFDNKPPGDYMVKAMLTSSVPGSSGYIPTYSSSASSWSSGATVSHVDGTDSLGITMIYGTVPPGPGFVSGYVYAGAGRGTTEDAPVESMLIYLTDAVTGNVVTYTYTDASGAYSFNDIGDGDYLIYPENFNYYTAPSSLITLSSELPGTTNVNFKKYTDSRIITPIATNAVKRVPVNERLSIFPNPTSGAMTISHASGSVLMISDLVGREVFRSVLKTDAEIIDIAALEPGVYMVQVTDKVGARAVRRVVKE